MPTAITPARSTLIKPTTWQTLYAIASTASNTVSVGSTVDVSTYYGATIRARMGRGTGTAFTTAPTCRIEGTGVLTSPTADDWVVLASFTPVVGASVGSTAVSGTEAAGQTVVSLTSGTNFTAGDYVFFHNTTLANSEWSRMVSVATNDITIEEGLVRAQTSATARDQAEQFMAQLDLSGINRLRVVIDGKGTGQANIWAVEFDGPTSL